MQNLIENTIAWNLLWGRGPPRKNQKKSGYAIGRNIDLKATNKKVHMFHYSQNGNAKFFEYPLGQNRNIQT